MSKKKERTLWSVDPMAVSVTLPVVKFLFPTFCKGDEVEFRFHGAAVLDNGIPLGFALQAIGFKFRREGNDIIVTARVRKKTGAFNNAEIGVNEMRKRPSPPCSDDWR